MAEAAPSGDELKVEREEEQHDDEMGKLVGSDDEVCTLLHSLRTTSDLFGYLPLPFAAGR